MAPEGGNLVAKGPLRRSLERAAIGEEGAGAAQERRLRAATTRARRGGGGAAPLNRAVPEAEREKALDVDRCAVQGGEAGEEHRRCCHTQRPRQTELREMAERLYDSTPT